MPTGVGWHHHWYARYLTLCLNLDLSHLLVIVGTTRLFYRLCTHQQNHSKSSNCVFTAAEHPVPGMSAHSFFSSPSDYISIANIFFSSNASCTHCVRQTVTRSIGKPTNNSILAIFMQKQITAFIFGFRPQFKSWSDYISSKSSLPVLLSSDIFSTFRTPLKWHGIPSYMSFQFSFNSYLMLRFAYTHFHFLCKAGELSCWVVSQKTQVIVDTIVDTM